MTAPPLLTVDDLAVEFETTHGPVSALQGVSFSLSPGEVLGIVGESGSGKTVACRSVMRLLSANARIRSGRIQFEGRDMLALDERALSRVRGERIAMIFQNPSTHLDPLMTVGRQVGEALQVHHGVDAAEARRQSIALLADMRIAEPERRVDAYAHQLSGGMRQRVMIAAALACKPSLLLADEPTTALDVTVQAQILDLLKRLRRERGLSIILVSHDLGVVAQMCDRVVVMKDGRVVERATTAELFARPKHPYTEALLAALPARQQRGRPLRAIAGAPPDLAAPPPGCRFHPRCVYVEAACIATRAAASRYWQPPSNGLPPARGPVMSAVPLLEVRNLSKSFTRSRSIGEIATGSSPPPYRRCGTSPFHWPRRNLGAGRREWLRQKHPWPRHRRLSRADHRRGPVRGQARPAAGTISVSPYRARSR